MTWKFYFWMLHLGHMYNYCTSNWELTHTFQTVCLKATKTTMVFSQNLFLDRKCVSLYHYSLLRYTSARSRLCVLWAAALLTLQLLFYLMSLLTLIVFYPDGLLFSVANQSPWFFFFLENPKWEFCFESHVGRFEKGILTHKICFGG